MFGTKYSRLTFWIWSVILLLPFSVLATFSKATEMSSELAQANFGFRALLFIIIIMWMNALANRIRDYGSNPWIALFSLVPLVNIGLSLYYGIVKYQGNSKKNESQDQNNSDISSLKAAYNNNKEMSSGIKSTINKYKKEDTSIKTVDEEKTTVNIDSIYDDAIYEQVMLEIEQDKQVKSTWARALEQSEGNESKAKSLYIQHRVHDITKEHQEKRVLDREKALSQFIEDKSLTSVSKVDDNKYTAMCYGSIRSIIYIEISNQWRII